MPGELADEIARESGVDPRLHELERLAAELHAQGVDFRIERGEIVREKRPADRDRTLALDFGTEHIRLGIVSDTHSGSKFEQLTALRAFYRYCDEQGVNAFIHGGDWTQGSTRMHRDQYLGLHAHGADAQVGYIALTYPASGREGVVTYGISGNHDDSFLADGGVNVVRALSGQRTDIRYVGQDAAYLTLGSLRMYVLHPDGGVPYAKSYRLQKIATALPREADVALCIVSHYHTYAAVREQQTYVLGTPCFQSQYPYLARKALHPDVGGVLLDLWLDDAGRLARVQHELVMFPVLPDDYDRDASATVGKAWAARE